MKNTDSILTFLTNENRLTSPNPSPKERGMEYSTILYFINMDDFCSDNSVSIYLKIYVAFLLVANSIVPSAFVLVFTFLPLA